MFAALAAAFTIITISTPFLWISGRISLSLSLGGGSCSTTIAHTRPRSPPSQALFIATFVLSCLLFETLLLDIMGWINQDTARILWKTVLTGNLVASLVLLPLAICYSVCPGWITTKHHPTFTLLTYTLLLYLFTKLTNPAVSTSTSTSSKSYFRFLTSLFSIHHHTLMTRVSVFGVALMAILSGFGAVFTPYTSLIVFVKEVGDGVVEAKEVELERTQGLVFEKRRRIMELEGGGGWDLIGSVLLGSDGQELKALRNEVKALEALLGTLNADLEELQYERNRFRSSKTLQGQLLNLLGYFFSFYCIYKIITSSINLVFHNHGGTDPITLGINLALKTFSSPPTSTTTTASIDATNTNTLPPQTTFDIEKSAQQLSFLMVGGLVICSIRGLIVQFSKVFRLASGTTSTTSGMDTIIIVFAEIMNMYCLSLVLMMRISLPPQYRAIITNVLGEDIQFDFYQRWFDFIFLVSAIVSMVFIFAIRDEGDDGGDFVVGGRGRRGLFPRLSASASRNGSSISLKEGGGNMDGLLGMRM
ncbi:Abscisic acid G-protein coupled receptor-domain-containing protein [Obelidium mucronatum]|nr:Abscisic acid G-protein coupled receptor-domain-containing protein [Obelidium mucronatum]